MSANISATRMNLLALKTQVGLAKQGIDLLKRKRDALVMEFFTIAKKTLHARDELTHAMTGAHEDLTIVKAVEGTNAVQSIAMASGRQISLQNILKNVWGVKIPEFTEGNWMRKPLDRGCSPASLSARMHGCAQSFENLATLLVRIASIEVRMRRMGLEIKKTTRRVNALEQIILPTMNMQIRYIRGVIEQREREDTFRLKKIKMKLIKKKASGQN